jgi:hypothetical protein
MDSLLIGDIFEALGSGQKGVRKSGAGQTKHLAGGGVTVNAKTVSRRSFYQVIHILREHNFSALFCCLGASLFEVRKYREFPVIAVKLRGL